MSARKVGIALGAVVCAAIGAYMLWFSSAGRFPDFPPLRNDYVQLGQAFLHGQLSLLERPDPRLATLPNPYDYNQRKDIPYHWDASYFQGKYYLYWGPVPALVAAAVQAVAGVALPGSLLVVLGALGLLLVFFGILIRLSSLFSGRVVSISIGLFVLIGFMNLPVLYTLGSAAVYETAILYGQFFLLGGLLAWMIYAFGAHQRAWLVAAGICWALAIGCRYNLVLSVAVYLIGVLYWAWREGGWKQARMEFLPVVAPLALGAIALGLYNLARFGNALETGFVYALSVQKLGKGNFSASDLASNLYIYLRYPLRARDSFPFIDPTHFHPNVLPDWLSIPKARDFDNYVIGLIPSVPVVWLLGLAIMPIIPAIRQAAGRRFAMPALTARNLTFMMIGAAAAAQFLFIMLYFFGSERFMIDFFPSLIIVLAMLVWRVDEYWQAYPVLRFALWVLTIGLALWTILIGFLSCFSLSTPTLSAFDPAISARLATFGNGLYAALHGLPGAAK